MKKIIHGKRYDTETAEQLLLKEWDSQHPNLSGGSPDMEQGVGLYRTKKGTLFGWTRVTNGWGRDHQTGATGAFRKTTEHIHIFESDDPQEALAWCEEHDCFSAQALERVFGETIEDA